MNFLGFAKQVVKEAGEMISSYSSDSIAIENKGSIRDVVTKVDRASEQLIKHRISEKFPNHQILGEEESFENKDVHTRMLNQINTIPFLWIVDPIDGTNNFVQNIPGFVVSIALICKGVLTVGVIYDPVRNEMFCAKKDHGTFMNDKKIETSTTSQLEHSVVGTSFSSDLHIREKTVESLSTIISRCRTARILGSAALNLAYVAIGRLTAFWHYELDAWDIAAGILIIRESGGVVTTIDGREHDIFNKDILASNKYIQKQLLKELNLTK